MVLSEGKQRRREKTRDVRRGFGRSGAQGGMAGPLTRLARKRRLGVGWGLRRRRLDHREGFRMSTRDVTDRNSEPTPPQPGRWRRYGVWVGIIAVAAISATVFTILSCKSS